jgi:hypothetical protein
MFEKKKNMARVFGIAKDAFTRGRIKRSEQKGFGVTRYSQE